MPNDHTATDRIDAATASQLLLEAERTRRAVPPFSDRDETFDVARAYEVQRLVVGEKLAAGDRVRGHKVGLTSAALQQLFDVDEPDYGVVLESTVVESDEPVPVDEMIAPRVEAEIAFVLERPLRGPGVRPVDVLAATRWVLPSLEIIDSRIADWRIRLVDTVADNASCGRVVLGTAATRPEGLDLRLVGMALYRNGVLFNTGAGAAALGHPAGAVAWLVNKLGELGEGIEAGELVMPGALAAPAVDLVPGDVVTAELDRLGSVTARFV
ncbi:MAG TPA: fumarylacetoacetate hydrolase family protein [Acidimicrobiales bacterium]|nr:fumarylacetoacetate hydrolase family protein [Acidimicrobiales bacterium]